MLTSCNQSCLQRPLRLRSVFVIHGLPLVIVTDNGSAFTSEEFKMFIRKNGIKHVTSASYHPSTNGQAERAVQTLKRGLKCTTGNSVQEKLSRFIFGYRITPHTTTGVPPCEMLMNHRLRYSLDFFHPEISGKVESRQAKQKELHDQRSLRSLKMTRCMCRISRLESQNVFLEQLLRSLVCCHT